MKGIVFGLILTVSTVAFAVAFEQQLALVKIVIRARIFSLQQSPALRENQVQMVLLRQYVDQYLGLLAEGRIENDPDFPEIMKSLNSLSPEQDIGELRSDFLNYAAKYSEENEKRRRERILIMAYGSLLRLIQLDPKCLNDQNTNNTFLTLIEKMDERRSLLLPNELRLLRIITRNSALPFSSRILAARAYMKGEPVDDEPFVELNILLQDLKSQKQTETVKLLTDQSARLQSNSCEQWFSTLTPSDK